MGSLSIDEVLKLLKVLNKTKQIKKKKRRKRNKYVKSLVNNNIKSTSDHMKGNVITGEHLRSIQDNNDLKMKAIQNEIDYNSNNKLNSINNTINDVQNQGLKYLKNYNDRINKIENSLSNIPNQSLTRENTQNYSSNNIIVPENDPYDSMSSEANLQPDQHSQEEQERSFSTIEDSIKPTNLSDNSPSIEEEEKNEEEQVEEEKNEEQKIEEQKIEEENYKALLEKYINNEEYINEYNKNFKLNRKTNKITKVPTTNNIKFTKEEKKEIKNILNFYDKKYNKNYANKMFNKSTKYGAYKLLKEVYHDVNNDED